MALKTVWFWKGPKLSEKWVLVANYASDEYPHPFTVESDTCPTESEMVSYCSVDENDDLVVTVNDGKAFNLPNIWYVLEEVSYPTNMVSVHAIATDHYKDGTVVRVKDVHGIKFKVSDRIGFIQWFREDSNLQQIFVAQEWRRMGMSTLLIRIADIVIISGQYGPHLNGGQVTTQDGEKLRAAWSHSPRVNQRIGSVEKTD